MIEIADPRWGDEPDNNQHNRSAGALGGLCPAHPRRQVRLGSLSNSSIDRPRRRKELS